MEPQRITIGEATDKISQVRGLDEPRIDIYDKDEVSRVLRKSETIPPGYPNSKWMNLDEFMSHRRQVTSDIEKRKVWDFVQLASYLHPIVETDIDGADIYSDAPGHILTIAPTRSGKGATQIIPTLFTYNGSIFTIDPKGENYKTAARGRSEATTQDCFRLDPFNVTGDTDHYNPMDFIFNDDDCRSMAKMMMPEPTGSKDDFWHNEALNLLAGIIAHEKATQGSEATLGGVADSFTQFDLNSYIASMSVDSPSQFAKDAAIAFTRKSDKEASGVLSTINQFMFVWKHEGVRKVTSKTDLDFADMKNWKCPNFTVFLIIPFEQMVSGYAPFLRVLVNQGINAMVRDKSKPRSNESVLFLLDEFANLGPMPDLVNSFGTIAGYGARIWIFIQNYHQLETLYDKMAKHILSETDTKCFFGNVSHEMAKLISEEIGETTVPVTTMGDNYSSNHDSRSTQSSSSSGHSTNMSFNKTPLIAPNTVIRKLGDGNTQLILHKGHNIYAFGIPWYEVDEYKQLGDSQY